MNDLKLAFSYPIPDGTLPWQRIFVGFIACHSIDGGVVQQEVQALRWMQANQLIDYLTVINRLLEGWLGSRVVSVLDSGAEGLRFKSQSRRCRVTVLGKLFTPIVPLFTKQQNGSSPLKGCGGNCRPGGK